MSLPTWPTVSPWPHLGLSAEPNTRWCLYVVDATDRVFTLAEEMVGQTWGFMHTPAFPVEMHDLFTTFDTRGQPTLLSRIDMDTVIALVSRMDALCDRLGYDVRHWPGAMILRQEAEVMRRMGRITTNYTFEDCLAIHATLSDRIGLWDIERCLMQQVPTALMLNATNMPMSYLLDLYPLSATVTT